MPEDDRLARAKAKAKAALDGLDDLAWQKLKTAPRPAIPAIPTTYRRKLRKGKTVHFVEYRVAQGQGRIRPIGTYEFDPAPIAGAPAFVVSLIDCPSSPLGDWRQIGRAAVLSWDAVSRTPVNHPVIQRRLERLVSGLEDGRNPFSGPPLGAPRPPRSGTDPSIVSSYGRLLAKLRESATGLYVESKAGIEPEHTYFFIYRLWREKGSVARTHWNKLLKSIIGSNQVPSEVLDLVRDTRPRDSAEQLARSLTAVLHGVSRSTVHRALHRRSH